MKVRRRPLRLGLAFAASVAASAAALADDPNASMRYVGIGAQRDASDNQSVLATLSLPVAQRHWVQFSGGQTRVEQDAAPHRATVLGAGVGTLGDGWLAALNATHRRDGERFRQTDWLATLEWRGDLADIGLDGSYRDARRQGTAVPTGSQRLKGAGLGIHGGVKLGERTRLYGSAMRYRLRSDDATSTPPSLVQALTSQSPLVARDELALRRSLMAGASHRFDGVAVSAEYLGDKLLNTPGTVHTVQFKAGIEPVPGWTLVPALGRSRGSGGEGVNFGALSVTRTW